MARRFGHTWWGQAWIDAIENRASLDPNRLPRGRTYARHGHVVSLETEPGFIRASVSGSQRTPYKVDVRFRVFTDNEWDRLAEVIVAKAERTAALLDGELDPNLVEDAAAAGIDLLPSAGELQPHCSCPDWADPCKHAAAVCYLVADELDADAFALLRLRGRDRDRVLAAVRRLRAGAGGGAQPSSRLDPRPGPDEGIRAGEAWARRLRPLPLVPTPKRRAGGVASYPIDPPPGSGFTATGLDALTADAVARAWAALADGASLGLDLPPDQDVVRRAATALGTDRFNTVADQVGAKPRALARRAVAWQVGGKPGLDVIAEDKWRADPLVLSAARDALIEAGADPSSIAIDGNRIQLTGCQLRLSRHGRWWRFVKRSSAWELDAGPSTDPDELLPD